MAGPPNTALQRWLEARWYAGAPVPWWLAALSRLFAGIVALRGWLYRKGLLKATRLPVPVLVVGNLGIGGAGKTPLTIALVQALRARGWRPGVVSRGYGRSERSPQRLRPDSAVDEVGDEPLLIARRASAVTPGHHTRSPAAPPARWRWRRSGWMPHACCWPKAKSIC
jgi:tetraacyldisaccharide 4'-kinase